MSEQTMPAAEANDVVEKNSYELAFHVLPTVAEGEVASVVETMKAYITTHGGELGLEEAPQRVELAYDIEKYLEGKYRKFSSAYFGWMRFTVEATTIETIVEELEANTNVLRHILLRLTKVEEANPFYYHEALAEDKQVANVDVEAALNSDEEAPAAAKKEVAEEKAPETEAPEATTEEAEQTDTPDAEVEKS